METQQLLIAGLVTVAVGGIGYAVLEPILSGANRAEKRQAVYSETRAKRRAIEDTSTRKRHISDSLKELDARKASNKLTLEQRFIQAGVNWTPQKFYIGSAIFGLVLGLALFLTVGVKLVFFGGLVLGALVLPRWLLGKLAKKRQSRFVEEFPNAIEAIVRGIRSGLPLNDCFRLVANEAKEPVRGEFRLIMEAQTMGISVGDAVMRIFERVPAAEVNFFAIVIQIQSKSGGNLGEVLSNLAKVIRERKKLRNKVDAMSTEAKASAGIIGSLPFLVGILVFFGSPNYIMLLWTTFAGKLGLVAAGGFMLVGTFVMKKMIDFEV